MKGTLVNTAAVLLGSGIGLTLKKGIPPRYQETIIQGLGLAVFVIGMQMALRTNNILIVIISLVLGAVAGEALDIDSALTRFGNWVGGRLGAGNENAGQGFITASLMFCVGAMALVGSIQDGLTGDATTLYAKSVLDGISSVVFSSAMGVGVALSSLTVLFYQGAITLLSGLLSAYLSDAVIREMTAVGGVMIMGISLLMLKIANIKVANLLPAIPFAAMVAMLWP